MKSCSDALAIHLNTATTLRFVDCWRIETGDGTVLTWSGGDIPVSYEGVAYTLGPIISGGKMRLVRGLEVDTQDITVSPGATLFRGLPLLQALERGFFDCAAIRKIRFFFESWGDPAPIGSILTFSGQITDVKPGTVTATLTAQTDIYLLQVQMPKRVYSPSCTHVFGDAGCGVDRGKYAMTTYVTGASTARVLILGQNTPNEPGYYEQGTVRFLTGVNAGILATVKRDDGRRIWLTGPLPVAPADQDQVEITPGCDRTLSLGDILSKKFQVPEELTYRLVPEAGREIVEIKSCVRDQYNSYEQALDSNGKPIFYYDEYSSGFAYTWVSHPAIALTRVNQNPDVNQYSISSDLLTLTFPPELVGKQITVNYSSDKAGKQRTCASRYNNASHFAGFPFVPKSELAV